MNRRVCLRAVVALLTAAALVVLDGQGPRAAMAAPVQDFTVDFQVCLGGTPPSIGDNLTQVPATIPFADCFGEDLSPGGTPAQYEAIASAPGARLASAVLYAGPGWQVSKATTAGGAFPVCAATDKPPGDESGSSSGPGYPDCATNTVGGTVVPRTSVRSPHPARTW
jgi:hypothetical protein